MTSQQLFVPCACLELLSADSINFNCPESSVLFFVKFWARGDVQVSYCGHPGPRMFPIYPIICMGSYKEPIFHEILLYFL